MSTCLVTVRLRTWSAIFVIYLIARARDPVGSGHERIVRHIRLAASCFLLRGTDQPADSLQRLYRSDGFAVAEPLPCRKSPAILAATRAAEALTESRARCA